MNIGLFANPENPRTTDVLGRFITAVAGRKVNLLAADGNIDCVVGADTRVTRCCRSDFLRRTDVILAFGGDGTILQAAAFAGSSETPILGVNAGRLGFLGDVTPEELHDSIDELLGGEYTVERRMMVEARVESLPDAIYALNDIAIEKQTNARVVSLDVSIEGKPLAEFLANGIVVSTPTGSTAYALSAGGPVIHPSIDALLVVAVCAHSLSLRPLVVPSDQTLTIAIRSSQGRRLLEADGRIVCELAADELIRIRKCPHRASLVHIGRRTFYDVLRDKLGWGRR